MNHPTPYMLWVNGAYRACCDCHYGEIPPPSSQPDHVGVVPIRRRRVTWELPKTAGDAS